METDRMIIQDISSLIETENKKIIKQIGIKYSKQVRIFLSPNEKIFRALTGNIIPDWGEGVADASQSVIILKSPKSIKNLSRFTKVVRHEIVHILVGQTLKPAQNIPKWFNEGVAIYFSFDEEFSGGKALSKALLTNSIVPLDEIDDLLNFHSEKARLAYEESYSVILYLEDKYGFESIGQLIGELQKGSNFSQAVLNVYEEELYDIELDWYHYIEKKYRWRFLLDFETYLWIFILLLFIFVFVAIRMRNRRIIRRWEDEELADF